jgi:hypothetical protein
MSNNWKATGARAAKPRQRVRRTPPPPAFQALEPLASRLEQLRLTQRRLAALVKISTNHYEHIAHAQANPSVLVLPRLAGALRRVGRRLVRRPIAAG